ncbi:hypothetical protein HYC85_015263 [Camellia sinensis]|uniref:Uncharacterized protein n=1 Tax=Camellia sinensis TaxID=4442 RepID=A0A7J7GXN8_CAMSI|nr:hypothetical protein HYC85_015263 [Camellia sinensis]
MLFLARAKKNTVPINRPDVRGTFGRMTGINEFICFMGLNLHLVVVPAVNAFPTSCFSFFMNMSLLILGPIRQYAHLLGPKLTINDPFSPCFSGNTRFLSLIGSRSLHTLIHPFFKNLC